MLLLVLLLSSSVVDHMRMFDRHRHRHNNFLLRYDCYYRRIQQKVTDQDGVGSMRYSKAFDLDSTKYILSTSTPLEIVVFDHTSRLLIMLEKELSLRRQEDDLRGCCCSR